MALLRTRGLDARFGGLSAASPRASQAARAASRKQDTRCEHALRGALRRLGLRYRVNFGKLPGRPDVVFSGARVAIFCDGDFWHGRNLKERLKKLRRGHNAAYWVAKIRSNVERDRRHDEALRGDGWLVMRFWETDIARDVNGVATKVATAVAERLPR